MTVPVAEDLQRIAEQAAVELADAPAQEILRWAGDTFGDGLVVAASMTIAPIGTWSLVSKFGWPTAVTITSAFCSSSTRCSAGVVSSIVATW